jgi:hypothetical protein
MIRSVGVYRIGRIYDATIILGVRYDTMIPSIFRHKSFTLSCRNITVVAMWGIGWAVLHSDKVKQAF